MLLMAMWTFIISTLGIPLVFYLYYISCVYYVVGHVYFTCKHWGAENMYGIFEQVFTYDHAGHMITSWPY